MPHQPVALQFPLLLLIAVDTHDRSQNRADAPRAYEKGQRLKDFVTYHTSPVSPIYIGRS